MGDSPAIRHFPGGPLGIDMDPLIITGCFSKLVNTMLVDDNPVRQADFLAFERLGIFNGFNDSQARTPIGQFCMLRQVIPDGSSIRNSMLSATLTIHPT